jgi:ribosome biogenesis GTPase A
MVFEKLFMKILNKERKPKQISILIIGLNNSGKSTIVNFFKNKDDRRHISVPTVGFNIEHFESESDFSHDSRDFDLP